MELTDRQIKEMYERAKQTMLKSPQCPMYKLEDIKNLDNIWLLPDTGKDGQWWVQDGYVYGTGKYIPIIEKLLTDAQENTDETRNIHPEED